MIIWIASYPKSGNTWVRAMLTSLLYTSDGNLNIEELEKIQQFPLQKYFKTFTNKFWDIEELSRNWCPAQDKLNLDNKIKFYKTHHAVCKFKDYIFTNKDNTLATIYIIRDPRNVITSLIHHYSLTPEEAKNFLFNSKKVLVGASRSFSDDRNILTVLGNWADNYNSWKKFNTTNLLVVKYEDLIIDTKSKLLEIINFLNKYLKIDVSSKKIENILTSTNFENLKKYETKFGFVEASLDKKTMKKIKFFNLGKENNWKNLLDKQMAQQIVEKFRKEMKELKYIN